MKRHLLFTFFALTLSSHSHAGFLDSILPKIEKTDPSIQQPDVDLRSAKESSRFFSEQAKAILNSPQGNSSAYKQMLLLAENGYSDALVFLGYLSDNGMGGIKANHEFAAQYFKEAAARGNVLGLHNLGTLFMFGRGVEQDSITGLKLLDKSAKKGVKHSTILIAKYQEGMKKYGEAAVLFKAVADNKNHPFATSRYGQYLLHGIGTPQSLKGAFTMNSKAAALWDPEAQWAMVEMYANGIGVAQNDAEALMWSLIVQKNPTAIKYHSMAIGRNSNITPEIQEIARQSADQWVTSHQPVLPIIDYSKTIWSGDIRQF